MQTFRHGLITIDRTISCSEHALASLLPTLRRSHVSQRLFCNADVTYFSSVAFIQTIYKECSHQYNAFRLKTHKSYKI